MQQGRIFFGEEQFSRADGSSLPVEVSSTPLYDGRRIAGSVTAFRDITRRKADEQRLRQAIADAESANEAKGAFDTYIVLVQTPDRHLDVPYHLV